MKRIKNLITWNGEIIVEKLRYKIQNCKLLNKIKIGRIKISKIVKIINLYKKKYNLLII
jgi:hypothetical protein